MSFKDWSFGRGEIILVRRDIESSSVPYVISLNNGKFYCGFLWEDCQKFGKMSKKEFRTFNQVMKYFNNKLKYMGLKL